MFAVSYGRLLLFHKVSPKTFLGLSSLQNVRSFLSNQAISVQKIPKKQSFTVSYLVNSFGLSLESAKRVAEKITLKSPERPDSILRLFKSQGFTDAQITRIVRMQPRLLFYNAEESILPKLEFFISLGLRGHELGRVLSSCSIILKSGLENTVIPIYNFIKDFGLSDEDLFVAFRSNFRYIGTDLRKTMGPNLALLEELGLPKSYIPAIIKYYSTAILQDHEKFSSNAKRAIEMGHNPQTFRFIHAINVFASGTECTWERKVNALRRWGWSEEQIQAAFRRFPLFMAASEKKMDLAMEFLVKQMEWDTEAISKHPQLLLLSLERNVFPRCLVIKVLQLKGCINSKPSVSTLFTLSKKEFMDRFVTRYLERVPELLNVYDSKISLQALKTDSKDSS